MFTSVNTSIKIPLYLQIAAQINLLIERGDLKPGDELPPEWELAKIFSVSKMTLRQGLNELVTKGRLVRRQGIGTFVSEPKMEYGIVAPWAGLGEPQRVRQSGVREQVLDFQVIQGGQRECGSLDIPEGSEILYLRRVKLVGTNPVAIQISFLPRSMCAGLSPHHLDGASLYESLQSCSGQRLGQMNADMETRLAAPDEARILNIPHGSVLNVFEGVARNQAGVPIEAFITLCRSDMFKLSFSASSSDCGATQVSVVESAQLVRDIQEGR